MNPIATRTLAYATKRWSESSSSGHNVDANFLWHEGHLGAIGSFLENLDLEYFLQNQRKRQSPSLDTNIRKKKQKHLIMVMVGWKMRMMGRRMGIQHEKVVDG